MNLLAVNNTLASLALAGGAAGLMVLAMMAMARGRAFLQGEVWGHGRLLLALAWSVSVVATAGSLYYSEVVGFVPCLLCWYQRIAMYPLVFVLGVATLSGDARAWRYALPLSLVGLLIAAYHVTIQFRPAVEVLACADDVPCTARYVSAFGFVSIPVMAGAGFILISALVLSARWAEGESAPEMEG